MSAARARHRRDHGRLRALSVVGVALAGLAVLASAAPTAPPASVQFRDASLIAPASATSSTWICAGLKAGARSAITLENLGGATVEGTMTVVGSGRVLKTQAAGVAAHRRAVLSVVLPARSNYATAFVQLHGGGVAMSMALHWNGLVASAPCVSSSSTTATFADAVSTRHTSSVVTLANPSSSAVAVVSVTAVTTAGLVQPGPLQGLVIPPLRSVPIDLATYVLNQPSFGVEVTALSGRIAASEDELGWGENRILTILPGRPALSGVNVLGFENKTVTQGQVVTLTNFTGTAATVEQQVTLPSGLLASSSITVPANATVGEPLQGFPGVPHDFPFTVTLRGPAGAVAVARVDRVWDGVSLWRSAEVAIAGDGATTTAVLPAANSAVPAMRWRQVVVSNLAGRPATVVLRVGSPDGVTGATLRLGTGQIVVIATGPLVAASSAGAPIVATSTGAVALAGRTIPSGAPTGPTVNGLPVQPS
jgi:Family of unknown function (DUF5719)